MMIATAVLNKSFQHAEKTEFKMSSFFFIIGPEIRT